MPNPFPTPTFGPQQQRPRPQSGGGGGGGMGGLLGAALLQQGGRYLYNNVPAWFGGGSAATQTAPGLAQGGFGAGSGVGIQGPGATSTGSAGAVPGIGLLGLAAYAMAGGHSAQPMIGQPHTGFGGSPYLSSITGQMVGPNMRGVLNGERPNWVSQNSPLRPYMDAPRIPGHRMHVGWDSKPMNYDYPNARPWLGERGGMTDAADPRLAEHQQQRIDAAQDLMNSDDFANMSFAERRAALGARQTEIDAGQQYENGRYTEPREGLFNPTGRPGQNMLMPDWIRTLYDRRFGG